MRCEVLVTQEIKNKHLNGKDQMNTDIEIWREATVYKTALTLSSPRELVRVTPKDDKTQGKKFKSTTFSSPPPPPPSSSSSSSADTRCSKVTGKKGKSDSDKNNNSPDTGDGDMNNTKDTCDNNNNLVDSALPPSDKKGKIQEFQKLKTNCQPEELLKLKQRCEVSQIINCKNKNKKENSLE